MLDPLAEVGIGMLMPVVVRCRQLVMDILRHSKRCERQQEQHEAGGDTTAQ